MTPGAGYSVCLHWLLDGTLGLELLLGQVIYELLELHKTVEMPLTL